MATEIEVIVPWRGGCQHRERAWRFLRSRYEWPVVEAPGGDPWVKADAVNPAVARSSAEIIVLADADCWTPGLADAIAAIERGAPWAIPHRKVHRLSEAGTNAFMAGARWEEQPLDRPVYYGVSGGGFVVALRKTLLEVPLDPAFVGWGQEDEAHARALTCLAGRPWRGEAPLVHLWHPLQERLTRKWGSHASRRRLELYLRARRDPERLRALLPAKETYA